MIKREVYQQPSESCVSSLSSDVPILATNVSTLSAYSSVIITLLSMNLSGTCISTGANLLDKLAIKSSASFSLWPSGLSNKKLCWHK